MVASNVSVEILSGASLSLTRVSTRLSAVHHQKTDLHLVINCLTDFLLALLPVPLIWQLKLNVRTRMSLIAILSLGVSAGAAGVFRATVFNTILHDPRRFVHDKWMMWNYVELTVGIIAGSLSCVEALVSSSSERST